VYARTHLKVPYMCCTLIFNNYDVFIRVCDYTGSFIDCFIGMPGCMHDSRVFQMSPLFHAMNAERPLISHNRYLIGDSAYLIMQFNDTIQR